MKFKCFFIASIGLITSCTSLKNAVDVDRNIASYKFDEAYMEDDNGKIITGGYGYIGISEAEANSALDFSCNISGNPDQNEMYYFDDEINKYIYEHKLLEHMALANNEVVPPPFCASAINSQTQDFKNKKQWVDSVFYDESAFRAVGSNWFFNYSYKKDCLIYDINKPRDSEDASFCRSLAAKIVKTQKVYKYIFSDPQKAKELENIFLDINKKINDKFDDVSFNEIAILGYLKKIKTSMDSEISKFWQDFKDKNRKFKNDYLIRVKEDISNMCSLSREQKLRRYPLSFRQALSDKGVYDKEHNSNFVLKLQKGLCGIPYFKQIKENEEMLECKGVSVTDNTFSIKKLFFQWPYGTKTEYTIVKSANDFTVKSKIKFQQGVIDEDKFIELADKWTLAANTFYNAISERMGNKINVKFEFTKEIVDKNLKVYGAIKIHKCFNADLKGDDRTNCDKTQVMRANSGNMYEAAHMGTLYHELAHHMNLDDEYYDEGAFYTEIGENNSIMNYSRSKNSVFFPRHFYKIIKPALICK